MRKRQPILIGLLVLWAVSCGANAANTRFAPPSRQREVTISVTSHAQAVSTGPVPTMSPSTSESACPPSVPIKAPAVSHFDPIEANGAIAYSGDGLTLAFPETKSVINIHSLTEFGLDGVDGNFVWSPDGNQIAFLYTDLNPESCARGYLMLADLLQGEVYPLIPAYAHYGQLAWSPDSKWLAFTNEVGELRVIRVSSGEALTISDQALGLSTPTWLDAKHVVYIRPVGAKSQADLVSQPLDGSAPRILLKKVSQLNEFTLSPDSQSLVYFGGALYLVDLQSGNMENLGLEPSERVQWSPNGEYLLGRGGMAGIYLARPKVSALMAQMNFLGLPGSQQTWAPNSQQFAALIGDDDSPSIGIYHVDTQTLDRLPVIVRFPWALAWNTR